MKKLFLYLIISAAALAMPACNQKCNDCDFEPLPPTAPPATAARAFLIYLAMDNNLSPYADQNIGELASASKAALRGGVIYALRDVPSANTRLLAIFSPEGSQNTYKITVKDYGTNLDTSKPEVLKQVWEEVQALTAAKSWVVSLGSHANGWFPAAISSRRAGRTITDHYMPVGQSPMTRSALQDDRGAIMDIDQIANALTKVDMLILDMCDMGGIESLWPLRKTANYIVASPAEVINKGMPYDKIVADIFNPDTRAGAMAICDKFYDLYYNFYDTKFQYGTIAAYDCSKFEGLATVIKSFIADKKQQLVSMNVSNIQSYDRIKTGAEPNFYIFDMGEFVDTLDDGVLNGSQSAEFKSAMSALVLNPRTTGKAIIENGMEPKSIPAAHYSGLATYIPLITTEASVYNTLTMEWVKTQWAKAVL